MATESNTEGNAKNVLGALSNPQFKGAIGIAVVLGVVLLFARDLADPSGFRNYLIGALAIYLIGTLFLVQTTIDLINHARNQAGDNPQHFPAFEKCPTAKRWPFVAHIVVWYEDVANVLGHVVIRLMPALHFVLFVLLIIYLFSRKCL